MQKVIFFLAGEQATAGELADIAKLNAHAVAPLSVVVRRGDGVHAFGAGDESADFVAGTIPEAYSESTEIDPDAIPGTLPEGSTVGLIDGADTEAQAAINADGKAELSGDFALAEDGAGIAGTGGTFTPTVENGVITGGTWVAA